MHRPKPPEQLASAPYAPLVRGHGVVAQLWRHPVKSLQGESLEATVVSDRGLIGDRAWGVRDTASGALLSAKREPRLLMAAAEVRGEGVVVTVDGQPELVGAAADEALSELLGRSVHIELAPPVGPAFVDEAPVHLLTVEALGSWDVRRFRPNLLLDVAVDLDDLIGRRISMGTVVVEVDKRTRRCAMTTAAQPGLPKDVGVLRALARERDLCQGVYARVVRPGRIGPGDAIRVT
jgi:uncharacterized protein YcbX